MALWARRLPGPSPILNLMDAEHRRDDAWSRRILQQTPGTGSEPPSHAD